MLLWILGIFTPLLTAGIGWLVKVSLDTAQKLAVMDARLQMFATQEQITELRLEDKTIAARLTNAEQRISQLEKP